MTNKIIQEKSELRSLFKQKRFALSEKDVAKKSQKICENFITNLLPKLIAKKPNAIFSLYLDSYNEVRTEALAAYFIKNKIRFSYPKIIEKNSALKFILHHENQEFIANKFYKNISEPKNGEEIFPDFLIIPLVAFDKKCNRLGMGGGFFDRTLIHFKTLNHEFITIGLAYDLQLYDCDIATEKTDQSLDFIASDNVIFS